MKGSVAERLWRCTQAYASKDSLEYCSLERGRGSSPLGINFFAGLVI